MNVLEKLRIPSEIDEEIDGESGREFIGGGDPEDDGSAKGEHRDPQPGEAPTRKTRAPRPAPRPEAPRITKKIRDEAAEEIETFLQMLALTWGWQAPPCGEALETAAPDIAEKVVRLLARKPQWLMRVRDGGIIADALGIALALKPVVTVAWDHYSAPGGGDAHGGVEFDPSKFQPYDGGFPRA